MESNPPSQVTGVTASPASSSSILLNWAAASDASGIGVYGIERCAGSGCSNFAQVWQVNALTVTDTNLTPSTLYRYRIRAQDTAGNLGAYSTTVEATTTAAPSAPTRRTLATDNFNTGTGALSANWTGGGITDNYNGTNPVPTVVSNRVRSGSTTLDSSAAYTGVATPDDQWAQLTLTTLTGSGTNYRVPRILLRFNSVGAKNGYECAVSNDAGFAGFTTRIAKWINGSFTGLGQDSTTTWLPGDVLRCEVQGSLISLYRNNVLLRTAIDTSHTSGRTGITLRTPVLAEQEIDDFSMGDYTVTEAPRIASLAASVTGATVTYGTTTPTSIRVQTDFGSVVEPIASFPSGVYTRTWIIGETFVCMFARDSAGTENSAQADYKCASLSGLVQLDTTSPVLSAGLPTGTLTAGTTTTLVSWATDEVATCRYSATDVAYSSMTTNASTVTGLAHSFTATGLTDGSTTTYYIRCQDIATPDQNANAASYVITFAVATAADTTPPVRSAGSPSGTLAGDTTSITLALNTNENATCKYGTVAGTAYGSIANTFGTTGTTAHSQGSIGVSAGNTYTYYVRCQDGTPNANTDDYTITFSVASVAPPPDVTPPVRTAGAPTGQLAGGTTNTNITLTTDENATCKFDTGSSVAYASMSTTFSTTGTTSHSHNVTGLFDGVQKVYYVKCQDGSSNANTTDYVIQFSVAPPGADTIAPTDPVMVSCSVTSPSQAACTFTAGTDAVGVTGNDVYLATGAACSTFAVATTIGATTSVSFTGLLPNTYYCVKIKAFDLAGNRSSFSNTLNFTTEANTSPANPTAITNLTTTTNGIQYNSVSLTWTHGTSPTSSSLTSIIERCQVLTGSTCTDFKSIGTTSLSAYTDDTVRPSSTYLYRGFERDNNGNVSVDPSNTLSVTTNALPRSIKLGLCPCNKFN